jgi:hypothetical protein
LLKFGFEEIGSRFGIMGPIGYGHKKEKRVRSVELRGRWANVVLVCLVLVPIAFNAIQLFPELSIPIPSLNDDAFHYLLVQRANEALTNGENPFDHWMPELELGFPQFFYYQHLPHLAVVFIHRLLLKQVDLFTLFNLIRYVLLVCFPITVFWSMRRMGFSTAAGAIAAAFSTLLSSHYGYGLEAGSYVWRGFGMYTQLWAMHLSFITIACLYRLFEEGKGLTTTIIACSALVLSHVVYAYMIGIAAIPLFFSGLGRKNFRPRLIRLVIASALAALITSYLWLPFLIDQSYLGASPYLQKWKYDSFGAADILKRLVNGDLLDRGRFPVLTILWVLGVVSAFRSRTKLMRIILLLFGVWLLLFFGRHTWGRLADFLPMHEGLLFHRFIGGVHLAAILLIGIGGEWLWEQLSPIPGRWRALTAGVVLLILMVPAIKEREEYYALNQQWMGRTRQALQADQDAQVVLSALKELPPGRTYAGLRRNWGAELKIGDLHFFDLLTFHQIEAVSPPYQSLSLNSDLIWHFDDRNPAHYDLFNVRYIVAPRRLAMAGFLEVVKETSRYTLYKTETGGYARFADIYRMVKIDSQSDLLSQNRGWMSSTEPAEGRFLRIEYRGRDGESEDQIKSAFPVSGKIKEELVLPGRIDLKVECQEATALVLKMTYHPNWRVTLDGKGVRPFMVSPSFIGFYLPAGDHHVKAKYRSPVYKTVLLILGVFAFGFAVLLRKRFERSAYFTGPK